MNCPVCDKNIEGAVCKNCGFVRIVFPAHVPDAIKDFDKERIRTLKKIAERNASEIRDAQREATSAKLRADDLSIDLERAKSRFKNLENERDGLATQIHDLKTKVRSLESRETDQQSRFMADKRKMNDEITDLQNQISRKNSEISRMTSEVTRLTNDASALRDRLAKAQSAPSSPLKGIVIIEDARHGNRTGLPVFEGTNTYGSFPDAGNHHQIKFIIRGYTFNGIHFTVRTSPKGLIFEAAPGIEAYQNGGRLSSAVYARQSDIFMLGEKVRISISSL